MSEESDRLEAIARHEATEGALRTLRRTADALTDADTALATAHANLRAKQVDYLRAAFEGMNHPARDRAEIAAFSAFTTAAYARKRAYAEFTAAYEHATYLIAVCYPA